MATNTNLGGVFTTDIDGAFSSNVYMSTENVVGIIFDTSVVGGFEKALGSGPAAKAFANGNVVELNSPKDYTEVGIDETLLAGIVKYHLDSFFSLAGSNQRLFVSFMNSDSDTEFEAIEKMQLAASGILYQIGVWTGKPIAKKNTDGTYSVEAGSVISKLQAMAELLGGKIGVTNYEGNAPLNIILNAPILNEAEVDIKKLPDVNVLEAPKVSVIIGQAPSDNVHKIMYAVNHVTEPASFAIVGNIGAAMGCLAVAPANESIGHVKNFNLATVMQQAELGFGSIVEDDENSCYDEVRSSFTNINTIGHTKRQDYIHKKGYIFTTNYDGLENSVFFSSDQTLSSGDYRTISRCRVMHKSRRVVRRALLPYVNDDIEIDASTGKLSASTVASFQNVVLEALDANMVEPGTTVPQISGRTCTIDNNQDILNTDKIDIDYRLVPHGCSSAIMVTEGFSSTSK
jgi:hypothetical protein